MDKEDQAFKRKIAEYALAEDRGVSLLRGMLHFAPGEEEAACIRQQIQEEEKHSRLFQERADALNASEQFMFAALEQMYELGQSCVDAQDWVACITCQNIIEELAMISFSSIYKRADETTKAMLREIIAEEKTHLDFTMEQLAKWVKTDEDREKVMQIQLKVKNIFWNAMRDRKVKRQMIADEWEAFKRTTTQAYRLHKERFASLGLEVPGV